MTKGHTLKGRGKELDVQQDMSEARRVLTTFRESIDYYF